MWCADALHSSGAWPYTCRSSTNLAPGDGTRGGHHRRRREERKALVAAAYERKCHWRFLCTGDQQNLSLSGNNHRIFIKLGVHTQYIK